MTGLNLELISKCQSEQMFWSEILTRRPQECDDGGQREQVVGGGQAAH